MSHLPECLAFVKDHIEPDYHLSNKYGETFIVLMIPDPQNIFAYWEVTEERISEIKAEYGQTQIENSQFAIRLNWPDHQKIIKINDDSDSWYISVKDWGIPLYGELGRILADGTFIILAVSNRLPHLNKISRANLKKWLPGISS